jgi:hypothetical protein
VNGSLFTANTGPINGGAINTQPSGVTTLFNSTFVGNTSGSLGGTLSNLGTTTVVASTLQGNRGSAGAAIATGNSGVTLRASILASGQNGGNCSPSGVNVSQGGNVADDNTCFEATPFDRVVTDVKLGPLADHGGPTATMSLLDGSPAIDAVPAAPCTAGVGGPPITVDQRGLPRPQGQSCDAGAFERQGGALQFSAPVFNVAENAGAATVTVTRTGGSEGTVGATFSTANDTAAAPADFTAVSSPVSFADGDTAPKTVQIQIVNDTASEGTETAGLDLANVTPGANLGPTAHAALRITDDDPTASASAPVKLTTSKAGAGRLQVVITAPSAIQTIAWTPGPNFAIEDSSGNPIPGGSLTVPAGSTSAVFFVRRTSGTSVTVPLTVTGGFGTWRTFVGGGPDAWQ